MCRKQASEQPWKLQRCHQSIVQMGKLRPEAVASRARGRLAHTSPFLICPLQTQTLEEAPLISLGSPLP